jgi:ABC-type sugar transport system substrate-binding protein
VKRIAAAVSLVAIAAAAAAQSTVTKLVFTTVDAVKMDYSAIYVTGVQEGATEASTAPIYCSSNTNCPTQLQNCEKIALLAMSKPGQYVLEIEKQQYSTFDRCTLRRVAP